MEPFFYFNKREQRCGWATFGPMEVGKVDNVTISEVTCGLHRGVYGSHPALTHVKPPKARSAWAST